MSRWTLNAPLPGEDPLAALQRIVTEQNLILAELEQVEQQVKGQAGYTAQIDSEILDMRGHHVCNAQQSVHSSDYITRAEAEQFALYTRGSTVRSGRPIEAGGGLTVPRAIRPYDSLPKGQAEEMMRGALPVGAILLWSGAIAAIPQGWVLCDGTNSTPDLRDRFVVGAGMTYAPNDTGGANTLNLAHTHDDGTYATGTPSATTTVDNDLAASTVAVASGTHTHDVTGASGSALSATQDIRPFYYSLAYIMKV